MKKLLNIALVAAMAFVLSSCFVLQSFSVLANSVAPGSATKAQFVLHPYSTSPSRAYQFVMVGVDSADLSIGKATWGTNGTFTGPVPMPVQAALPGVLTTLGTCSSNGLDVSTVTGMTWKAFTTPTKIADKGLVAKKVVAQVVTRAKASAVSDTNHSVFGVTGVWVDNTSSGVVGSPDAADTYYCSGIATSNLYVS
jgi:hypothetical protein